MPPITMNCKLLDSDRIFSIRLKLLSKTLCILQNDGR